MASIRKLPTGRRSSLSSSGASSPSLFWVLPLGSSLENRPTENRSDEPNLSITARSRTVAITSIDDIRARFERHFGPHAKTSAFSSDIRSAVWIRMVHALSDTVKTRSIRAHFIKTFHPDNGTDALSFDEKNRIMAMHDALFGRD